MSSALAEKHTFVFALGNEKEFSSSSWCPSVRVRFRNRPPGLKWTENSKTKSFTVIFNITEQSQGSEGGVGVGGSFLQLVGLKDACY